MISVHFENRDFTPYPHKHWEMLQVQRYSKNAFGYSKQATIIATGALQQIWEFIEMLRCPVILKDESRKKSVWWGFIKKVTISDGESSWVITLDDMANRIAVVYSYQNKRFTTAWSSNTESLAEYGQKDLRVTEREVSSTVAIQKRDTEIESRKYPIPRPSFRKRRNIQVKLHCVGWIDSLDWRYFSEDEGSEVYEDFGRGEREIGEDDRPKAAQGFQLSSAAGWTISALWLRVRKVGSPADNFQTSLYDDSGTAPNASLSGTPNLAGGNITASYDWYEFVLDTPYAGSISTLYWIHTQRSGAVDASNYYLIDANKDQGYANGNLYIQRSSDSSWYNKNMDALFRVVGEEETTTQISGIIADVGEFFSGTTIEDASGVNSTQYRRGDQTALYEILRLLKTGTTNNLRLLAEVTEIRKFRVFEEPPKHEGNYIMSRDGEIRDQYGGIVPPQDCPVGVWMQLKEFIPSMADVSQLATPSPTFVEEAEYNAITERYRILKSKSSVSAIEVLTMGGPRIG